MHRHFCWRLAGLAALLVAPVPAHAAEWYAEPAKVLTQDAYPVAPGSVEYQLALGLERAHQVFDGQGRVAERQASFQHGVALAAVVGLARRLDLSLGMLWAEIGDGAAQDPHGQGPGDARLELRWQVLAEQGWALAYLPRVVAPLGNKVDSHRLRPGQPYWSLDNTLVGTWVGGRWSANVEGSIAWPLGDDRRHFRAARRLNAAAGYQLTRAIQLELELLYDYQQFQGEPGAWQVNLAAGAVLQLRPELRLDLAWLRGLDGRRANRLKMYVANMVIQF